jgi:hypothetical protein
LGPLSVILAQYASWLIASSTSIFYASHYKFLWPAAAAMLTFVGLYWLYTDFINADPRPEK